VLASFVVTLAACGSPAGHTDRSASSYEAEITWTEFGVPHVVAEDWGGLGYGLGYAYAGDNFCMLAEKVVQLRGERSRYEGPDAPAHAGTSDQVSSRASDFYYRSQLDREALVKSYRESSDEVARLTAGYAAGVNRYLDETGADDLPEACRGAEWVGPITEEDLYAWYAALRTLAGSQQLIEAIVAARPPSSGETADDGASAKAASLPAAARGVGSNAWAFGADATASGRGLLFGNPHWVWGNMNQFYLAHLTLPGELDVMGAAYGGIPAVVIGFNRSLAWSHTVSTGSRFVIRELRLEPGSPTTYLVDGEPRQMEASEVTIQVADSAGELGSETRTLYSTEYGPVVQLEMLPWTDSTAYALTDLNLSNHRLVEQWVELARAPDVGTAREVLGSVLGVPWVNTLAADAEGGALYADYSVKPYVTDEMLERCAGSERARQATDRGLLTLDGSTQECDLPTDPGAPQPGILPPRLLPALERPDYVANSNNSYWLTNPAEPVTGLPRVNGGEGERLSFRAQAGLRAIEARLDGRDGLPGDRFDREAVKALVFGHTDRDGYGNRNRAAEVVLEAVVDICEPSTDGSRAALAEACQVLAGWDGRHDVNSTGAHVFREFWDRARGIDGLWETAFDPEAPLDTPRNPAVGDPDVRSALQGALVEALADLEERDVALDAPWGDLHRHPIGEREVPIPVNDSDVLNMLVAP
jgi:acyl-homoserine-lactone acylase